MTFLTFTYLGVVASTKAFASNSPPTWSVKPIVTGKRNHLISLILNLTSKMVLADGQHLVQLPTLKETLPLVHTSSMKHYVTKIYLTLINQC